MFVLMTLGNTSKTIINSFDTNINWSECTVDFPIGEKEVHVWKVGVAEHFHELFKKYRTILNADEITKAKAFYRADDFRRYITSKIMLRVLLSKYLSLPPSAIQFSNKKGKPTISSSLSLRYNLSYGDKVVLISVGVCETGIDIEKIRTDFNFEDMLPACFSKEEINAIAGDCGNSREEFFLQWTRKEAVLKYTGQGIIDDLTVVPSLNGSHNTLNERLRVQSDLKVISFKANQDSIVSLAYPSSVSEVKYFEWL